MIQSEITLSTIAGESDEQRLQLVLLLESNQVELRQQSWGNGVGWFTQNAIKLASDQVASLRSALGTAGVGSVTSQPASPTVRFPVLSRRSADDGVRQESSESAGYPRVLRFDEAPRSHSA